MLVWRGKNERYVEEVMGNREVSKMTVYGMVEPIEKFWHEKVWMHVGIDTNV